MTELTPLEQARIPVPPHGRWFTGIDSQKLMLDEYHAQTPDAFAVGWDTQYKGKMFGVYASCSKDEFMHLLLDIPWAQRHCYELLVENVPCKAYADVEWVGPAEPEHTTLKRMIAAMRDRIREMYSREPLIYVCCGSRPHSADSQALTKHSYHIVCDNLIFERNNDGQMKALFTTNMAGFTWMDGVEEKPMIDTRVYTKNRHFRLPHCCKIDSQHPLLRISGDPLLDEFGQHDWGRDVHAVLPFFISNPAYQGRCDCLFVPTPSVVLERMNGAGIGGSNNNKRARINAAATGAEDQQGSIATVKLFPVPLQIVQRLLMLAGDTVTTLGSVQYLNDEDQWKIQGDQRGKGRNCLVSQGITHTSNNCLLFIERFQNGFKVNYFCTARECSCHTKKMIIGYISMNVETFEWQIALSSPPPAVGGGTDTNMQIIEEEEEMVDMQEAEIQPLAPNGPQAPPPAMPVAAASSSTDGDLDDDVILSDGDDQSMMGDVPVIDPPVDTKNPVLNTYAMVRDRYKDKWFKVCNPSQYVVLRPTGQYILYKHDSQFKAAPDVRTVYYYDATDNPESPFEKKKFVHAWLADEDIHLCESVIIDPTVPQGAGFDLNLWTGFDAVKLPPVPDEDVLALVAPIRHHILRVHASDNAEHARYNEIWYASPFQRPHQPTGVAILLYGKEGCGKGIISTFHRMHVLGKGCSYHTEDAEVEIFSKHADGLVNKVFVQADEVKISMNDRRESLKNIITNETITFEPKFAARMTVKNMVNLLMTTNNENAVSVSPTCRRYALFRCSNVYKGNIQYFTNLAAHLRRPEVARAWYQYLMTLDMGEFTSTIVFQELRPRTEYLREAQQATVSCVSRFLSAIINRQGLDSAGDPSAYPMVIKDGVVEVTATLFYNRYQDFHTKGNYKYLKTQTSFGREIKRVDGCGKIRAAHGFYYKLNLNVIKQHLVELNEYDEDAMVACD